MPARLAISTASLALIVEIRPSREGPDCLGDAALCDPPVRREGDALVTVRLLVALSFFVPGMNDMHSARDAG
jgi:hypothetical protein